MRKVSEWVCLRSLTSGGLRTDADARSARMPAQMQPPLCIRCAQEEGKRVLICHHCLVYARWHPPIPQLTAAGCQNAEIYGLWAHT